MSTNWLMKIYQGQEIAEDWYITGHQGDGTNIYWRVDHYWRRVFETQNLKEAHYTSMSYQSLDVLCITHTNAEVERSLSKKSIVNKFCCLINWIRLTKKEIRMNGSGNIHKMSVTPSLIQARRSAYAVYTIRMHEGKGSNNSRLHVVEPPRSKYFIWKIGVNSSIQNQRQVDKVFWSRASRTRQQWLITQPSRYYLDNRNF